jgi:DNA primase
MSTVIDFQEVKTAAGVDQVIKYLNLTLKQQGDTWRGCCHMCKNSDPRSLIITTSKKLFHCFKCKRGGDMLKLVAESRGVNVRDAAVELMKFCGMEPVTSNSKPVTSSGNSSPQPDRKTFDVEKYLSGLDPAHAALETLGISPETLKAWKAGYSAGGVNRGRLALPIHAKDDAIVGYFGMAVSEQQPFLIFPNGTVPSDYIFGSQRVAKGELYLLRTPLDVLKAWDNGADNAVSFLTETISSAQLQYLSVLMDEKQCDGLVLS